MNFWTASRRLLCGMAIAIAVTTAAFAFQKTFRVYPPIEGYDDIPLPADYKEPAEWVFARLMYPPHPNGILSRRGRGWRGGGEGDWRDGRSSWTQDYPRADRHFAQAMRRLTRVNVRSVEQPVNLEDGDDAFNWPWMCAGEMGDWLLTPALAAKLRDYLLRGGFLMLDDFFGPEEWDRFAEGMSMVFPDREIVEIDDDDPIFHSVYDLKDRYQILGRWSLNGGGGMAYRAVGTVGRWKGIYDDRHRLMVAMCFNSDVGDSWEWADDPTYPEKFSALGIRIGVNYVIYALTH